MSFIGLVANVKKANEMRKYLKEYIKYPKVQILDINKNSIENIQNIQFETIVICDMPKNLGEKESIITEILKKSNYLIINSDLEIDEKILQGVNIKTITYGLKQKSTITASSITESNIVICVQREIQDIYNHIIEPHEINIKINKNNNQKVYDILSLYSIIKLYNGQNYEN